MVTAMTTIVMDIQNGFTKTALLSKGKIVEVVTDTKENIYGNIYLAIAENVQKNFAFLDIGTDKHAFLQLNNVYSEKIKGGQKIIVQIKKLPTENKGPFVSRDITFVGKNILLLKSEYKTGIFVSDKIDEKSKNDLKLMIQEFCPPGFSIILRTLSQNATKQEIVQEIQTLYLKAQGILNCATDAPALLYSENSNACYKSTLMALLNQGADKIIINNEDHLPIVNEIANQYGVNCTFAPGDVFDEYEINNQLDKLLKNKIWLKSGGYIVIDKTTALTVIDVNSGKYTNKKNDINLITNLEAATEIAMQLRLRNISGIIIIDFINIENTDKLIEHLSDQVKKDRIPTKVVGITSLGLVELTRKRMK